MDFCAVIDIVLRRISFHHDTGVFIGQLNQAVSTRCFVAEALATGGNYDLNRRVVGYVCAVS
jgi:hypothetical protein